MTTRNSSSVFMADFAGSDRRSVKAHLKGNSLRAKSFSSAFLSLVFSLRFALRKKQRFDRRLREHRNQMFHGEPQPALIFQNRLGRRRWSVLV